MQSRTRSIKDSARRSVGVALGFFALALPCSGATIQVPSEQPNIAAGLMAALPGDTVLVAAGSYFEHGIELKSQVALLGASGNPEDVIIDAGQQDRVLLGIDLEENTIVSGLTLKNGRIGSEHEFAAEGAGVRLGGSSPIFRHCIITENRANLGWGSSLGGGVSCRQDSHPIFENCAITHNAAEGGTGGGIYVDQGSSVQLIHCEIAHNEALQDFPNAGGVGGIRGTSELESCFIFGNRGESVGAASGATRVEYCVFYDNSGVGNAQGGWGSCGALVCDSSAVLRHCTFVGNRADITGAISSSPLPRLEHCLIFDNMGWKTLTNNVDLPPKCTNIHGNEDGDWEGALSSQLGSNGNISADPQFCGSESSGNFYLQGDSPCAPGHHPDGDNCGYIGALPVACGGTLAQEASWSAVKTLYRF